MDDVLMVCGGKGQVALLSDEDVVAWPDFALWVTAAAEVVGAHVAAYMAMRPWDVTLRVAGNHEVQRLNKHYRQKDKPTNVLSFPNEDDGLEERRYVGDVILALPVVEVEAAEMGIPVADHVRHLVVHGLLHLVGYDHMTDTDAAVMQPLETKLLAILGVPDPYEGAAR